MAKKSPVLIARQKYQCISATGQVRTCVYNPPSSQDYVQYVTARSQIQELPVRCTHVVKGCDWHGTISTLEKHLSECEWAEAQPVDGEFYCEECIERHKQDQPYIYCKRKLYKDSRNNYG